MKLIMAVPAERASEYQCDSDRLVCWVDRNVAEENPEFRQVIPYVLVRNSLGDYLVYSRKGAEGRLHGRLSMGIGGHVDAVDGCFESGYERELEEELGIQVGLEHAERLGLIILHENMVDRVHLGVVLAIRVPLNQTILPSEEIGDYAWMSPAEILRRKGEFESWSQEAMIRLQDF